MYPSLKHAHASTVALAVAAISAVLTICLAGFPSDALTIKDYNEILRIAFLGNDPTQIGLPNLSVNSGDLIYLPTKTKVSLFHFNAPDGVDSLFHFPADTTFSFQNEGLHLGFSDGKVLDLPLGKGRECAAQFVNQGNSSEQLFQATQAFPSGLVLALSDAKVEAQSVVAMFLVKGTKELSNIPQVVRPLIPVAVAKNVDQLSERMGGAQLQVITELEQASLAYLQSSGIEKIRTTKALLSAIQDAKNILVSTPENLKSSLSAFINAQEVLTRIDVKESADEFVKSTNGAMIALSHLYLNSDSIKTDTNSAQKSLAGKSPQTEESALERMTDASQDDSEIASTTSDGKILNTPELATDNIPTTAQAIGVTTPASTTSNASTNFSGKPCPDRAGSSYPHEGSGVCRGNMQFSISLPTTGIELIYNSQSSSNYGYGKGWSLSIDRVFEKLSNTSAWLYLGDGTPIEMTRVNATSNWVAKYPVIFDEKIEELNATSVRINRRNGIREVFNKLSATRYFLTQVSDRANMTLMTIGRASDGRIKSIKDRFSREVTFQYPSTAQFSVVDYLGKSYLCNLDSNRNLISVRFPDNVKETMSYIANTSFIKSLTDREGRLTSFDYFMNGAQPSLKSVTDYEGLVTSFTYTPSEVTMKSFSTNLRERFSSSNGFVTRTVVHNGGESKSIYDPLLRMTSYTNSFGLTTTYKYQGSTPYLSNKTAPDGMVTTIEYDTNQFPKKSKISRGTAYIITEYTPNSYGDVLSIKQSGKTTTYEYDTHGQLKKVIDPSQKVAFEATFYSDGLTQNITDSAGYKSNIQYDANRQLKQITTPELGSIDISSTMLGQIQSATVTKAGVVLQNSYDEIGRVKENSTTHASSGLQLKQSAVRSQSGTTTAETLQVGTKVVDKTTSNRNIRNNLVSSSKLTVD